MMLLVIVFIIYDVISQYITNLLIWISDKYNFTINDLKIQHFMLNITCFICIQTLCNNRQELPIA